MNIVILDKVTQMHDAGAGGVNTGSIIPVVKAKMVTFVT